MDDVDGYLHLEHSDADLIVLDPLPVYLESELGDEYVCVTVNRQLGRVVVETSANVYDEVRLDIATLLETPMFCNRSFNVDQLRTVVCAALIEFDVVLAELKETDWLFDGRYQNAVDGGVTALIANPDTSD
jgi:hypothetical protein